MNLFKLTLILYFIISSLNANSQNINYLQECWNKQVKPINNKYLKLEFHETLNELVYDQEPWHSTKNITDGFALVNGGEFIKSDSLFKNKLKYNSKLQLDRFSVLYIDYGDYKLSGSTVGDFNEQFNKTARFSPINFIDFFYTRNPRLGLASNDKQAIYSMYVGESNVQISINKSSFLVDKIIIISDDDFLCDVQTSLVYTNYKNENELFYPTLISISKYNDKIKDEVSISKSSFSTERLELIPKPEHYALSPIPVFSPDIVIEKYNPHINIVKMLHADVKSLIIEFKDFFLISDAPLNTRNGSLLIAEAKRIAKDKPIKYYAFGHRDPHFLGGIRAFINEGANILCSKNDINYIKYFAKNSRKVKPDILLSTTKEAIINEIKDSKTISDGEYEMKLYYIGNKANLYDDYIIYYFTAEKLLFVDDLIWINKVGQPNAAGKRQTSLYNAIKDLGIQVDSIIQSYPARDNEYKTKITFKELENSVNPTLNKTH